MWVLAVECAPSLSMAITLPSMKSERLMLAVSFAIWPSDLDALRRSLPARSMKDTLPNLLIVTPSRLACVSTLTVMMEWERLESLLSSCEPTRRFRVPMLTTASASSSRSHSTARRPGT